jgi:hypothetical protein
VGESESLNELRQLPPMEGFEKFKKIVLPIMDRNYTKSGAFMVAETPTYT